MSNFNKFSVLSRRLASTRCTRIHAANGIGGWRLFNLNLGAHLPPFLVIDLFICDQIKIGRKTWFSYGN